jgi:HD-like signal output (HDOD) protein
LDKYISEKTNSFQKLIHQPDTSIIDVETRVLGIDHAKIGGELCSRWNMPDFVSDAITFHHSPSDSQANLLAYVLHSADSIAHAVDTESIEDTIDSIDDSVLRFLRFKKTELIEMANEIFDGVEKLEEDTY